MNTQDTAVAAPQVAKTESKLLTEVKSYGASINEGLKAGVGVGVGIAATVLVVAGAFSLAGKLFGLSTEELSSPAA